jgi:hypothetical protein
MADQAAPIRPSPALINYTWMAMAVLCPIAMALPPRRMDIRFMVLSGGFSFSTDQLLREYTGRGVYQRFSDRLSGAFTSELPERAKETQRRLREERERREAVLPEEERRALENTRRKATVGLFGGLLSADEGEGWKEKRLEAHRKGMEEGKGISDLIMDHVSEAFKGKDGEAKKDDESDESEEKK